MNVEIEAEAALFPEKEYINGIAVEVYVKIMQQIHVRVPPQKIFVNAHNCVLSVLETKYNVYSYFIIYIS